MTEIHLEMIGTERTCGHCRGDFVAYESADVPLVTVASGKCSAQEGADHLLYAGQRTSRDKRPPLIILACRALFHRQGEPATTGGRIEHAPWRVHESFQPAHELEPIRMCGKSRDGSD